MNQTDSPKTESRREFLSKLFMGGGLLASAVLLVRHGIAYIFPKMEAPVLRKLLVGRVNELKPGEAKEFQLGGQSLYLVNTDAGYKVYSAICTHLGCKIKWESYNERFFCPCHRGVFRPNGAVTAGPPPRPLDEYRVEVQDRLIYMWVEEKTRGGVV